MSIIDLSAGWITNMMGRIFKPTPISSDGNNYGAARAGLLNPGVGYAFTGIGQIHLMKGTVPSDFSTLTSLSVRASDILWKATSGTAVLGDFVTSQVTVNPAIISTQYVTALASGAATWFWWTVTNSDVTGVNTQTAVLPFHQIIGTVGITGSGADLEIPNTNIVSGEQYRIMNLRIQFPTTWTY